MSDIDVTDMNFSSSDSDEPQRIVKLGKKRSLNTNRWKRNVSKKNKQSGKGYVNSSGVNVEKKTFKYIQQCCSKLCWRNISYDDQKRIFQQFYGLSDNATQNLFLNSCMNKQDKKTQKIDCSTVIKNIWEYSISLSSGRVKLCRSFLLQVFQISEKRIRVVQNKGMQGLQSFSDNRGKHTNRPNKIDSSVWSMIDEHLQSIPHEKSHYSPGKSNRLYFENPSLNIKTLFDLFKDFYLEKTGRQVKMKYASYFKYFHNSTMYTFKKPRTDVCDLCFQYEQQLKNNPGLSVIKTKLELHQKRVAAHKSIKQELQQQCKNSGSQCLVIEFDYGQNLPAPKLSVTAQFYKRLLWINIFNVHCHNDGSSVMYCFPETASKKNPDSVVSCLYQFIMGKMKDNTYSEIVFLSDNAGGQNKNITMVRFCTFLANLLKIQITHLFPIRGHSYGQNDRNFGVYAKKLKNIETIFTGEDYISVIEKFFSVVQCDSTSMLKQWGDFLKPFTLPKPTARGYTFTIQSYVRLKYNQQGTVMASSSYSGNYIPFKFLKTDAVIRDIPCVKKNPIKEAKKNDIRSLYCFLENHHIQWYEKVLNNIDEEEQVISHSEDEINQSRSESDEELELSEHFQTLENEYGHELDEMMNNML